MRVWLRSGLLAWRRRPLLAASVVLTLGVALALGVIMSAVLATVSTRALVFPHGIDVVEIHDAAPEAGTSGYLIPIVSYGQWRDTTAVYRELSAYQTGEYALATDAHERVVTVTRSSGNLLAMLGVPPLHGRLLTQADEGAEPCAAVILSQLAAALYGSARAAIDRRLQIDGNACFVVGTVADEFAFPSGSSQVFLAIPPRPHIVRDAAGRPSVSIDQVRIIGRPSFGVPREQLEADAQVYFQAQPRITPLQASLTVSYQRTLELLRLATLAVLAVAALNVSSMLAAGAIQRFREWALKGVLGASRAALWRESLLESLALCGPGLILGVTITVIALGRIRLLGPIELANLVLDNATLWTWVALCAALCLVSSLPAWLQASRLAVISGAALTASGATASSATSFSRRLMPGILIVQIAVSIVLVVVTLLFSTTLWQILTSDRGFSADDAVVVQTYREPGVDLATYLSGIEALRENMSAHPGVIASFALELPVPQVSRAFSLRGEVDERGRIVYGDGAPYRMAVVGPRYFQLFRTPVLVGRDFHDDDGYGAAPVAVVSTRLAERRFGSIDAALGQPIDARPLLSETATVVGVVPDVTRSPWEDATLPSVYVSCTQVDRTSGVIRANSLSRFVLLSRGAEPDVTARLDASSYGVLLGQPWTVWQSRLQEASGLVTYTVVTLVFAGVTLALIGLGVYGVTTNHVRSRLTDAAIRQAIGATPVRATWTVWLSITRWWVLGVVLGWLGSFGASRALGGWQASLAPLSISVFGCSVLVVTVAVVLAVSGPIRRILRVQPASLLRV